MEIQYICCICHVEETEECRFVDPNPCACKGTNKIHYNCLEELIRITDTCGVCRRLFRYNFTGVKREFWPNGQLQEEEHFVNGQSEGSYRYYNHDGQLIIECNYVNGKLDGCFKRYYYEGQLQEECIYVNGVKEGISNTYYSNGQLKEEIT